MVPFDRNNTVSDFRSSYPSAPELRVSSSSSVNLRFPFSAMMEVELYSN